MRLIDVDTLALCEFASADTAPPYAILSHTWGTDEVSYQDLQKLDSLETAPAVLRKAGFEKIRFTCEQAKRDGLRYAWVDTCCIDKSSSHELSEAINSMYRWYGNSTVCYVYLADVPGNCPPLSDHDYLHPRQMRFLEAFEESRWFTRGWTLQELIAPRLVLFYGQHWNHIGTLGDLVERVSGITNIQSEVLNHSRSLSELSIARRLSWAARRETTRKEDQAYSLLGILDVNMPLLYGEGEKAFQRLQEEIIKQSTDQSIFAWNTPPGFIAPRELLLAPSPRCFMNCNRIRRRRGTASESAFRISNKGLEITLPVMRKQLYEDPSQPTLTLGILDCRYEGSSDVLALVMDMHPFNINSDPLALELYVSGFERSLGTGLQYSRILSISPREAEDARSRLLTITRDLQSLAYFQAFNTNQPSWFPLRFIGGDASRLPQLRDAWPEECWFENSKTMRLEPPRHTCGGILVDTRDGKSVLVVFGMHREVDVAPTRKIYGLLLLDKECPIMPHLDWLMLQDSTQGSERAHLRLSETERIVAQLWHGALTLLVETVDKENGFVPPSKTPSLSPLSPPSSPILYTRRPSSFGASLSRSGSSSEASTKSPLSSPLLQTRKPSLSAISRRDSLVQDTASDRSQSEVSRSLVLHSQPILLPHRIQACLHCRDITDREQAEQARRREEKWLKDAADEAERQRQQRNQAIKKGVKRGGVLLSMGGILEEVVGGLELLG